MPRRFDHIDLRVPDLAAAEPFYRALLPALGFTREGHIGGWIQYIAEESGTITEFFGVTEDPNHQPNRNRIAFWVETHAAVDRLALFLEKIHARRIEGPLYEDPGYYAVFFEDPFGNRLEICHRTRN